MGLEVSRVGGVLSEQVRGMKTRSSVKKLCDGCKVCIFFSVGFLCLVYGVERNSVFVASNWRWELNQVLHFIQRDTD